MELLFLFLLGLLVGSFLNVVIFRMECGKSFVVGRSECLQCGHQLAWYDNIPLLSFLILKGKCRYCKAGFSWQYPAVELLTGVLFMGAFVILQYSSGWEQGALALALLTTLCFAILIAVYDLRFSLIPNVFLWGINISTAVFLALHWLLLPQNFTMLLPSPSTSLLGAGAAGVFFLLLVVLSKETWMGWGDVWLGVWGGMLVGIALVQIFITLSFSLGALVGLTLLYQRKKTLKAEIPFAPYILLAGIVLLITMYQVPEILQFLSPWVPATIE